MGQDAERKSPPGRVEAALAAVRRTGSRVGVGGCSPDEFGRAAFGGVVRAQMTTVYGVQLPRRLGRVVEEAAVLRLTPEECVAAIGEAFKLRPLPVRR